MQTQPEVNDEFAPMPAEPESVEQSSATASASARESSKACCICGRDVTLKKRGRDHDGRYWCTFCQEFGVGAEKLAGMVPCPDCGRETRPNTIVEQGGEKVCHSCNEIYVEEARLRRMHKKAVTANREVAIRRLIRKLVNGLGGLAAVAILVTLYHFGLLYFPPKPWVPFLSALYCIAVLALGVVLAIGVQHIRIAWRKRTREEEYDKMIQAAANHILAIDDENHTLGVSESPEPLRRRVERAVARCEACAGDGNEVAAEIIKDLAEKGDPSELVAFLLAQRPGTEDTVARNREITTVCYLQGDLPTASSTVAAILLRLPHDQDAMTRWALITFRAGDLELSKKIFKRVVNTAKEKNNEVDLAAAYCNLGMLHMLLSEFDDAAVRYSQAKVIYKRLKREAGEADCLVSLGLIGYKKKEKGDETENLFREAMRINSRRKRREGLSICCSLLGVILFEKEEPKLNEAEKLLNKAVKLNFELGRPGGVAAAYGNLGLVRAKRGDLPGASEMFLKAQSIYQRINRPKMMAKIQGMLRTVGTLSAQQAGRK
jgi:tetratricopeptide (TPR) repeat protein